jgi:hypothetical protein
MQRGFRGRFGSVKTLSLCALVCALACGANDDPAVRPTANAGFDLRVKLGDTAHLDASASESDVTYMWSIAQQPDGSKAALSDAATVSATFAPDVVGPYMIALTVRRDQLTSEPDVVMVNVFNGAPTSSPQCASGSACKIVHGRNGGLDGRASSDPDSDVLSYQWTQVASASQCAAACPNLATCSPGNAVAAITNASAALATFTAPNVAGQNLVFALDVSDGTSHSSACVVYTTIDTAPVATLAPSAATVNPSTVGEGHVFSLSGAGSGDPDGDTLTYDWVETASGYAAVISNPTNQATTVTAPTIAALPGDLPFVDLTFTLTVSDGVETDDVSLTVRVTNDA